MPGRKALHLLSGGGLITSRLPTENILEIFMYSLIMLLVKGVLVMLTYNWMVPRMIQSIKKDYLTEEFQGITIWEGVLLVILFTNLFNRW